MSDLAQYEIDDPGFVEDILKSDSHVDKVILWLKKQKLDVRKRPVRIRDDVENMSQFSDDGDADIVWKGKIERLEIKQRHLNFTSATDFPYSTIIVDVAHTWEKADPKPLAYILTNDDVSYCAIVKAETSDKWIKVSKWDKFKKRNRTFLECPVKYLEFRSMS